MVATSPLIKIFGRSPFKPIEAHMDTAMRCALCLTDFFAAANAEDWPKAMEVRKQISQLEHDADKLKVEIRSHLPNSLFMPVARTDLLELVTVQDKVANTAKSISGIVIGREQAMPQAISSTFDEYLQVAINTTAQANTTIKELDELLETGFRGQELDIVDRMISELDNLEHQTDDLEITLRRELKAIETTLPPVDVFFLYNIIDQIGELANIAQRVGSRLMVMLAR